MDAVILNDYGDIRGGADYVAVESAVALADQGVNVWFVCACTPISQRLEHENINVVCIGQGDIISSSLAKAACFGIWNRHAAKRLMNVLEGLDRKNSIVHVHSFTKALSSAVFHAVRAAGFRTVFTAHDYFAVCPNGALYDHREMTNCKLKPMSFSCFLKNCDQRRYAHKIWRYLRGLVQASFGRVPDMVDAVLSVSNYSDELLRSHCTCKKFFRVDNPVNIEKGESQKPWESDEYSFMGRLSAEKGPIIFARAAGMCGARAVFIGDGPQRENVEAENENAAVTGWLSPNEANERLKSTRALVFPSTWHETLGLSVLMAKAMGIPAMVSSGCAATELVMDGVDGFIFKKGDANDLSKKIGMMDDDRVMRFSQQAYKSYWENPNTPENHAKRLIEVYRKVLGGDAN